MSLTEFPEAATSRDLPWAHPVCTVPQESTQICSITVVC